MNGFSRWLRATRTAIVVPVVLALLVAAFLVVGGDTRTLTASFDRATAVYPGTEVRVMGVRIGEVTALVPDGNSVRVEMEYDAEYQLPAGARAAVVTPTLVADRYVQVFPAYAGGPEMPDGGDIPLDRTQTPIELDRMFSSLDDLATTLGPKEGETSGALDGLLSAGAAALDGNGALGSETIRNLSAAAETFAANRGPLFETVRDLAQITDTLAANDSTVEAFVQELAAVSEQFAGEREELEQVLASLADVLGSVEGFVGENREALSTDVELLTSLIERVDRQKEAVGLVVQKGPLALGNLAVAFEPTTGTFGSRLQIAPGIQFRPDQFLCQTLLNAGFPAFLCDVVTGLLEPLIPAAAPGTDLVDQVPPGGTTAPAPGASPDPLTPPPAALPGLDGPLSLLELLGGGPR
ncbi:virulence factor Mce family protein [Aeromicrobium marinum DSM 15272]|uniref:Virulence factor Mce family protein n=1 Tax=Aeromicrobium marinum DSM 15272 TaxID=585531 RepID=E2SEJ7_9ACTN|nr:MCE family protein [Aeromicrobium marinum]EFQ82294.1 virulence factor Mce family protein [Aeromicrobium marinum DSM 15272]